MNISALGYDYDTARVLTCGTLDTGTTHKQPLCLSLGNVDTLFFKVFHNIAVCSFLRYSAYCTCTEYVPCTKKLFYVFMCSRLIVTGEVKVDIRLLVSVETKEGLERYIVAVLYHRCTAYRTILILHIISATYGTVPYKLAVFTRRAYIVRRK